MPRRVHVRASGNTKAYWRSVGNGMRRDSRVPGRKLKGQPRSRKGFVSHSRGLR